MATPKPRPWTVLEHGPIERLEDNLWSVAGELPSVALRRRMTVVRLADGKLVLHSCMPLREPAMKELEAWGEPAYIVVPNIAHRLDAHAYKTRYPAAKVVCGAAATSKVAAVVGVDGTFDDLPKDAALRFTPVRGARADGGEHVFIVTSGNGHVSLVMNDVVFNHPHLPGLGGLVLRLIGSSGGPRVTFIARKMFINDKAALRTQLLELAETPKLERIVVSHVDVIDSQPAEVLRQVAGTL